MNIPRAEVMNYFAETYRQEYDDLGVVGVDAILDRGRTWDLAPVLKSGGAIVFPHVHIADCGPYVAATVHACLDSGADQVLAIGVLHAATDEMDAAKTRATQGVTLYEAEPLRGVYGEGLPEAIECWKRDHGLYGFRRLLLHEAERRGVMPPKLIERYPFLTGPNPETLPGIEELESMARDSVLVSTADHCHHGIGYGDSPEDTLYFDEAGMREIHNRIETGLHLLDAGRCAEYIQHCVEVVKSDWRDAGPVVHHLRGPLGSNLIDMVPSDFSNSIYASPKPTWAAGALVLLERA